jgi:hypothetical protein
VRAFHEAWEKGAKIRVVCFEEVTNLKTPGFLSAEDVGFADSFFLQF